MKKQFFVIAFILISLTTEASHIVGGGLRLNRISGYNYRLELDLYYSVWTNPFENTLAIFFESNSISPFTIQLINSTGAIVKEYNLRSQTDTKYQIEIETGDLPPGLYFSRISNGIISITKPVAKL